MDPYKNIATQKFLIKIKLLNGKAYVSSFS